MTSRSFSLSLLIMLWFSLWPAQSALAKNYKVEVIVFQNLNAGDYEPSQTDGLWQDASYDSARDLRYGGEGGFQPVSSLSLAGVRSQLDNSGGYRVLDHIAWQQPGLSESSAIPVRIQSPGVLDGTITVTLSRFLHVYTDMQYSGAGLSEPVQIKAHRRMRSRELHYIDHPLIGMIISITPV